MAGAWKRGPLSDPEEARNESGERKKVVWGRGRRKDASGPVGLGGVGEEAAEGSDEAGGGPGEGALEAPRDRPLHAALHPPEEAPPPDAGEVVRGGSLLQQSPPLALASWGVE